MKKKLEDLQKRVIQCNQCKRLRKYCQKIGQTKRKAYLNDTYWTKPVPGFGDPKAQICIVGLAPAAHGANRTGRMFTGDRSGLWLYRALHRAGLCNLPESTHPKDGLKLINTYLTSVVHCAPPDNKPTRQEQERCTEYLKEEIQYLKNVTVFIALGQIGFNGLWKALELSEKKPKFGHGVTHVTESGKKLVLSYHPSQQNTFTKRLTEPMFDAVFEEAKITDLS